MEGKTLEELRESLISTVESYGCEMGFGYPADENKKESEDTVEEFESAVLEDERKRLWKAVDKPEGDWCRKKGVNWNCPFYNYGSFFIRCELFGEDLIHDDKCEKCRAMNYDEAAPVLAPPDEKPKIGKETCKTYSESWCKGQDCRVCQFNIPGMGPAEEKP